MRDSSFFSTSWRVSSCPAGPEPSLLWPAGRIDRHPPVRHEVAQTPSPNQEAGPAGSAQANAGGGASLRPSGEAAIPSEAAGPERASRGGVSLAQCHANSEGTPPRGVPARSQPEELRAAGRGGDQGPKAANPRGKQKSLHAARKERASRVPVGQERPLRSGRDEKPLRSDKHTFSQTMEKRSLYGMEATGGSGWDTPRQRRSGMFVVITSPAPKPDISRTTWARKRLTPSVRSTCTADQR
jgi:hypothetical protein